MIYFVLRELTNYNFYPLLFLELWTNTGKGFLKFTKNVNSYDIIKGETRHMIRSQRLLHSILTSDLLNQLLLAVNTYC